MDPVRCICKREQTPGGRWITVSISVNWGDEDERANWAGIKEFHSFACLATWADGLSDKWDSGPNSEGGV